MNFHQIFRDALGVGNQNSGIMHLGKSGPGSSPCCGNERAYVTLGRAEFDKLSSGVRCQRCENYAQRRQNEKPVVVKTASAPKEPSLPPWGSKPAREMSRTELRSWIAKNPRKQWKEILETVLATKMMRGEDAEYQRAFPNKAAARVELNRSTRLIEKYYRQDQERQNGAPKLTPQERAEWQAAFTTKSLAQQYLTASQILGDDMSKVSDALTAKTKSGQTVELNKKEPTAGGYNIWVRGDDGYAMRVFIPSGKDTLSAAFRRGLDCWYSPGQEAAPAPYSKFSGGDGFAEVIERIRGGAKEQVGDAGGTFSRTSPSTFGSLANAARSQAGNEAAGRKYQVYRMTKSGGRVSQPSKYGNTTMFTRAEAEEKVKYWEGLNPGSKYTIVG